MADEKKEESEIDSPVHKQVQIRKVNGGFIVETVEQKRNQGLYGPGGTVESSIATTIQDVTKIVHKFFQK